MFKTLIVALDLEADGDRALPVVQALARTGAVTVELVTVSSPGMPPAPDAYELIQRAQTFGWAHDVGTVVHDIDPALGLVQHVARRPEGLLVMATSARRPWASSLFGSVPHDVLRATDRPVLMIGPHVAATYRPPCTTLVACVDAGDLAERTVPAIVAWQRAFTCAPLQIAEVVAAERDEDAARRRLDAFAAVLATQHVHAVTRVVVDDDAVSGLEALSSGFAGPIYVATSARYTDGRMHWHSTTQQLVNRATCPVLVVPARPMPVEWRAELDDDVRASAFDDITMAVPQPDGA